MSLFASSFASGSAGPSLAASASATKSKNTSKDNGAGGKNDQKKRKRPSLGDGGKDNQLKSTTANLQKLMKKVENASSSSSSPRVGGGWRGKGEGGESIGHIAKKSKGRKSEIEDDEEEMPKTRGKGIDSPVSGPGKKGKGKGAVNEEETPKKVKKSSSGVEPAELPLPHTIRHETTGEDEGLTKMQRDMKAKLEGARFRWINEQLYSTPSTEAVAMMQKDPKIFSDYHLTHRALTSAWPQPPLPHLISLLTPLPARTVIADLGCGDAGLAKALVPQGKIVLSYDLVGDRGMVGGGKGQGWVVESDFLTSVPLPGRAGGSGSESVEVKKGKKGRKIGTGTGTGGDASEIVDVVICCLSLMGTNWIGGIYEACRILKPGGTFHIAEVTSRFVSTPSFTQQVESFGFDLVSESSPSTHFTLFEFTKTANVPQGVVRGENGWEKRLEEGGEILRACVYKKR